MTTTKAKARYSGLIAPVSTPARAGRLVAGTVKPFDPPRQGTLLVAGPDEIAGSAVAFDERSGEVAVLHAAAAATDAYEWLQGHARQLERYAGRWIAVTSRGVLADAASLPQLRQITDVSGLSRKEIVVFRLPTDDVKKIVRNRRS